MASLLLDPMCMSLTQIRMGAVALEWCQQVYHLYKQGASKLSVLPQV